MFFFKILILQKAAVVHWIQREEGYEGFLKFYIKKSILLDILCFFFLYQIMTYLDLDISIVCKPNQIALVHLQTNNQIMLMKKIVPAWKYRKLQFLEWPLKTQM